MCLARDGVRGYNELIMRAHSPDYILIGIIVSLLVVGLTTLFSASSARAAANFDQPAYYLVHQLLFGVLPGLLALSIAYRVHYRFWKRFSFVILIFGVGLLLLVFSPQFGVSLKGASRWVEIGGIVVQPAEFFKLGFVMFLASFFASRQGKVPHFGRVGIPFLIILGVVGALIMAQPATGTFGVIMITALGLYFLAGARIKNLVVMGVIVSLAFGALVFSAPYRLQRMVSYLNPQLDPQGAGYQIQQALIGIGSGGLLGAGIGHSKQKFLFLPETIGDSIFAIFAEEAGFVGAVVVISLFFFLAHRGFKIARQSRDTFARLLAGGIVMWVVAQAFINIAAISGLVPLTGIPLPFFSYGGSAMVAVLAATGILLNLSRYTT